MMTIDEVRDYVTDRMSMSMDDEWPDEADECVAYIAENFTNDDYTTADILFKEFMNIPVIPWYMLEIYEEETILRDNIFC